MPGKNGRLGSWTAIGALLLSALIALVTVASFFGGRLQSPEQKKEMVRTEATNIMLRELEEPKRKIAKIETKVEGIEEDVKEIKDLVREIRDNQ